MSMDKEKQRKLILEAQGWSDLSRSGRRGDDGPLGALRGTSPDGKKGQIAPNPLTNLNAMHEAEKVLTDEGYEYRFGNTTYSSSQVSDYNQLLLYGNPPCFQSDGCGKRGDMPPSPNSLPHLRGGLQATAPQRAEAFLRCIGRWTE